jgi:ribosomal protein S12 methylthiotransferase
MAAQAEVAAEVQAAKVGRTLRVIVDNVGELPGEMIGRSEADAPDIDGRVTLATDGTIIIGDLVEARIDAADGYDLRGSVLRALPWRPNVPQWG